MNINTNNNFGFTPGHIPPENGLASPYYFLFYQKEILVVNKNGGVHIPGSSEFSLLNLEVENLIYFGELDDNSCYALEITEEFSVPEDFYLENVRALYGKVDDDFFWLSGRAAHLINWDLTHQFCGRCGTRMQMKDAEKAKECPKCHLTTYPRISPAIIVAITKGDQILLGRGAHWKQGTYSVLAGFVDVGESLEDCVRREVMEEVNIEVKNIKYFGSQPWAFPDSLMVGFTAEYANGEIEIDEAELEDAQWFNRNNLPGLSNKPSISRELIDWYINNEKIT